MYRLIFFRLSESYFRHRWLYLLPIALLLAFAVVYMVVVKPTYSAQGILYIQTDTYLSQLTNQNQNATPNWWTTPAQNTSNEINELIQTDAFIRAVIQGTNLEKGMTNGPLAVSRMIDAVRKDIWVTPQGDNQVAINAKYDDALVSIQLANGVIDNYIRWHTNGKRNDSEVALNFFTSLIGQYRSEVDKAHAAMADYIQSHPAPAKGDRTELEKMDIARLQSDINQAETRYSSAMDKEENARLSLAQIDSESKQIFTVIDAPHIPPNSVNSRKDIAIKYGIFGGIGLLLSIGLIVGTALFDHSFLLPSDVQNQLNLPVLAVVEDASPKRKERQRAARKAKEEAKSRKQEEKQRKQLAKAQEKSHPSEVEEMDQDEAGSPVEETTPVAEDLLPEPQNISMDEANPVLDKASL